jgi:hypothetical protein
MKNVLKKAALSVGAALIFQGTEFTVLVHIYLFVSWHEFMTRVIHLFRMGSPAKVCHISVKTSTACTRALISERLAF